MSASLKITLLFGAIAYLVVCATAECNAIKGDCYIWYHTQFSGKVKFRGYVDSDQECCKEAKRHEIYGIRFWTRNRVTKECLLRTPEDYSLHTIQYPNDVNSGDIKVPAKLPFPEATAAAMGDNVEVMKKIDNP